MLNKQDRPLERPLLLVTGYSICRVEGFSTGALGPSVAGSPCRADQQGYRQVGHDSGNYDGVAPGCQDTDLGDRITLYVPVDTLDRD